MIKVNQIVDINSEAVYNSLSSGLFFKRKEMNGRKFVRGWVKPAYKYSCNILIKKGYGKDS